MRRGEGFRFSPLLFATIRVPGNALLQGSFGSGLRGVGLGADARRPGSGASPGGNREAAEYSGVNVRAILSAVMIISAVCSGVAGMLGVAYFGSAQQNEFDTYLLDSISAVVVGGTSLFGGQGGIGNTIIGLFVLGILNNGLDHINIDSFLKILIRGLVLLVALAVNVYAQRMRTVRMG